METRSKIKSFQFIQSLYQAKGFYLSEKKEYGLFSKIGFVNIFILFLASLAYLVFKTKSIGDVTYSYSATMGLLFGSFCMLLFPIQIPSSLTLIERFDDFIQTSELGMFKFMFLPTF